MTTQVSEHHDLCHPLENSLLVVGDGETDVLRYAGCPTDLMLKWVENFGASVDILFVASYPC